MKFFLLSSIIIYLAMPTLLAKTSDATVLNDSWYTMQAGSAPWGIFHEVIEQKKGRFYYKYEMTKKDGDGTATENIGAIAEGDLTPVAFNLNKSGGDLQQGFDGTYEKGTDAGVFTVKFRGSIEKTFKRTVSKDTILEVFFPVWIRQHWAQLGKGSKGSLPIFTEEPNTSEYHARPVQYVVGIDRPAGKGGCREFKVELDGKPALWCITSSGALVDMVIGSNEVIVKRVPQESAARAFLGLK